MTAKFQDDHEKQRIRVLDSNIVFPASMLGIPEVVSSCAMLLLRRAEQSSRAVAKSIDNRSA
jgi:hypothetical protein